MDATRTHTKFRGSLIASTSKPPVEDDENESGEISTKTYSICDGFQEDCQELLDNFLKRDSIRYKVFAKQWKESKFDTVFCGRPTFAELWEFYEEALNIAAKFLLNSDTGDSYHKSIAGLYLVYKIHKHDITKKARVRVLPSSVNILRELLEHSRANDHLDALYILSAMLRDGVFKFVITENEYGIGLPFQKTQEKERSMKCPPHTDIIKRFSLDDSLDNLVEKFKLYHSHKSELSGVGEINPPKELNYIDQNFTEKLIDSINNLNYDLKILNNEHRESLSYKRPSLPETRQKDKKLKNYRSINSTERLNVIPSENLLEDYDYLAADNSESEKSEGIWEKCLENLDQVAESSASDEMSHT